MLDLNEVSGLWQGVPVSFGIGDVCHLGQLNGRPALLFFEVRAAKFYVDMVPR
jgi:hypothetical protein